MACNYICLIAYEVELMKLIFLSSYEKCLFTSGLHFKNGLFVLKAFLFRLESGNAIPHGNLWLLHISNKWRMENEAENRGPPSEQVIMWRFGFQRWRPKRLVLC